MTTVQYTEPVIKYAETTLSDTNEDENTAGFLTGGVVLIILLGLFFYFLLPYIQKTFTP